jgi:hypothetical protein
MGAVVEEFAEMLCGLSNRIGLGHADAVEAERARLVRERGLQIGGREFCGVQKSRST